MKRIWGILIALFFSLDAAAGPAAGKRCDVIYNRPADCGTPDKAAVNAGDDHSVGNGLSFISVALPAATMGAIAVLFSGFAASDDDGGAGGDYRAAGMPPGNLGKDSDDPLTATGARFAAEYGFTGAGVRVAVMDTGVAGTSAVPGATQWHGTAVANIIRSAAPDAAIDARRITDGSGTFASYTEIAAHFNATDAFVINNSWGIPTDAHHSGNITQSAAMHILGADFIDAMRAASRRGAILVWAAGNEGAAESNFIGGLPIAFPDMNGSFINVVSYDLARDALAANSNRCGATKDFCLTAPGENIALSAFRAGNPNQPADFKGSGTSFAAPFVSAAAAILKSAHRDWSGDKIAKLLFDTARDLGDPGADETYGRGMVDLENALTLSVNPAELKLAARPKSLAKLQAFGAGDAAPEASFGFAIAAADHTELLGGLAERAPATSFGFYKNIILADGVSLRLAGRAEYSAPRADGNSLAAGLGDIYAAEFSAGLRADDWSFAVRRPLAVVSGDVDLAVPGIWSRRFSLRENPAPEFEAVYRRGSYRLGAIFSEDETIVMLGFKKRI